MSNILDRIIVQKRLDVARDQATVSTEQLQQLLALAPPVRDFHAAISGHKEIRLIAEVKKASPSKGIIRADFDPLEIAKTYAANGAAALSVLTDESFFQGNLDYLREIRKHVAIPILRKDFVIDEYQVLQARVAGADAILLIAECLESDQLVQLYQYTRQLGMHALIELYDPENLEKVLRTGCPIVGINNRDLRTFEVDLNHTVRLREQIDSSRCVVSESGIFVNADVEFLRQHNVNAILVGESLMRQTDVGLAVRKLLYST